MPRVCAYPGNKERAKGAASGIHRDGGRSRPRGGSARRDSLWAGTRRRAAPLHSVPCSDLSSHAPSATESSDHVIRIKAAGDGHYYIKGSADGVPLEFMIDTGASNIVLPEGGCRAAACRPAELRPSDLYGQRRDAKRAGDDPHTHSRTVHRERRSRVGEWRTTRYAVAGHELAPPLPIDRNRKRRHDAPLRRNVTWSMSAGLAGCRKKGLLGPHAPGCFDARSRNSPWSAC